MSLLISYQYNQATAENVQRSYNEIKFLTTNGMIYLFLNYGFSNNNVHAAESMINVNGDKLKITFI